MKIKIIAAFAATSAIAVALGAGSFAWFTSTATSSNNKFQTGTLSINRVDGQTDNWYAAGTSNIAALDNLLCSDQKDYKFTVNNLRTASDDKSYSSLDLLYKNDLVDFARAVGGYDSATKQIKDGTSIIGTTNSKDADLLNGLLFDLVITRIGSNTGFNQKYDSDNGATIDQSTITYHKLTFNNLHNVLNVSRKMNGGAKVEDEYRITATLPYQIFGAGNGIDSLNSSSDIAKTSLGETELIADNDYQGAAGAFKIKAYAAQNVNGALFENDAVSGTAVQQ